MCARASAFLSSKIARRRITSRPEVDEQLAHVEQPEHTRALVDDRQHDHAEAVLQLGVLVQVVQDHLRRLALAHIHDDAHAVAVALVAHVDDALDALLVAELGDLLDQVRLVDLIRDLGDDDRFLVALAGLDLGARAHDHLAAAGAIRVLDPRAAADEAGGREVGPVDARHHAFQSLVRCQVLVLDQEHEPVDHLAQIVRRDVGGHADRDTGRAVDEQVRQHRRQHDRLGRAVVVRRLEVDRLLLDVRHHRSADARQPALGVAHRGGGIAVDGAEVSLAVDERRAHVPVLRHAHERVVDRAFAVGVIVAHHFAGDLRALLVRASGLQPHLLHAVEHAPVRGLHAVTHVRQRAADDHRHRVVHVGLPHLVGDVGGQREGGERRSFFGHLDV
jgi:hypothetical protein